jgi:hypothetical protein
MFKFILRDMADSQFDDLITFDEKVNKNDIINLIENLKKNNEEYTNEDVYNELAKLGSFTIEYIGQYEIIEY